MKTIKQCRTCGDDFATYSYQGKVNCPKCRRIASLTADKKREQLRQRRAKSKSQGKHICNYCGKRIRDVWKHAHESCLRTAERGYQETHYATSMSAALDAACAKSMDVLSSRVRHIPVDEYLEMTGRPRVEPIPKQSKISFIEYDL